jgi:hypothetical protein
VVDGGPTLKRAALLDQGMPLPSAPQNTVPSGECGINSVSSSPLDFASAYRQEASEKFSALIDAYEARYDQYEEAVAPLFELPQNFVGP